MISGTISLYDRSGELMDSKKYWSYGEKKKIIKDWEKEHAAYYTNCYLQIAPTTQMYPLVNKDGTNKEHS